MHQVWVQKPHVEMIEKSLEDCSRSEVRMEPRHGPSVLLPLKPSGDFRPILFLPLQIGKQPTLPLFL